MTYEDEKGSLNSESSDEYVGMGYGNAFDMFGEAEISSTTQQVTEPTTQSSTKQYQVAVKKNDRTPTEKGSEEQIKTTTTAKRKFITETLDYYHVKKNQDVKGTKLRTLSEPSESSKKRQLSAGYLIAIKNPDPNYQYDGVKIKMTDKDIDIADL